MVLADPATELLRLVRGPGDPPATAAGPADLRAAALIRRRFGLALPLPLAGAVDAEAPIRPAGAADGAAIAAVKWRAFGVNYRGGVLPDAFLDGRDVVPPVGFWTGRAMLPPSRRHRLLVWGRPGTVFGYLDAGPVHPDDADPEQAEAGEVFELYVDPAAQGLGGGSRLLAAFEHWCTELGWTRAELNVLAGNRAAQDFYAGHGWAPTGRVTHVDLGVVAFDEARWARRLGAGQP